VRRWSTTQGPASGATPTVERAGLLRGYSEKNTRSHPGGSAAFGNAARHRRLRRRHRRYATEAIRHEASCASSRTNSTPSAARPRCTHQQLVHDKACTRPLAQRGLHGVGRGWEESGFGLIPLRVLGALRRLKLRAVVRPHDAGRAVPAMDLAHGGGAAGPVICDEIFDAQAARMSRGSTNRRGSVMRTQTTVPCDDPQASR